MSRLAVRAAVTVLPGLDGDPVGVGPDADLDGLPRVAQPDLDLLAANHDRPAD